MFHKLIYWWKRDQRFERMLKFKQHKRYLRLMKESQEELNKPTTSRSRERVIDYTDQMEGDSPWD